MTATIIVGIVLGVTYANPSTNNVALPITSIVADVDAAKYTNYEAVTAKSLAVTTTNEMEVFARGYPVEKTVLNFKVTFPIYLIALMSFLGWFFFVIFAGVGLVSVPSSLINAYIETPKEQMDPSKLNKKKRALVARAKELEESGNLLKKQYRRNGKVVDKKMFNRYKKAVYDLEKDSDEMDSIDEMFSNADASAFTALMAFVYLILGGFSIILSFFWILHICLYILPVSIAAWEGNSNGQPISLFLNAYFAAYDGSVPLFGALSVMIFTFYLMICVISGNLKVGTRIFIVQIHPMRIGRTLPNSILVNVSLILMTSPAITQFSTQAFADYVRMTDADNMFGAQIKYITFLKPFFDHGIMTFVFLGFSILALVYYLTCGRKVEGVDEKKMLKMLKGIADTNDEKKKKKWYQWG
jgi:LMBR1 domain-containing protein 1